MAMGPEAKLWKALKPRLDELGCFSTRLENRHGGGLPDVDVSSPFGVFKVELKIVSKNSVRISDMQIAYNTLLNCKHGLSFILAEHQDQSGPLQNANPFLQNANEDQGPRTEGRVGSGRGKSGRGRSGLGPRSGSGRVGDRYYLWVGSEAVDVGRSGLRHEALATSDSLADLAAVMVAVCAEHHRGLLEKAPRA